MNERETILAHHRKAIEFVKNISENQWRTRIEEGKWTVAEVIGHLPAWDEFVLKKRIPLLFFHVPLPKGPEAGKLNEASAKLAREQSQRETTVHFVDMRTQLYEAIENIPLHRWQESLTIGSSTLTLADYLQGLKEHDEHHFRQIKALYERE
ncbi:DinB family protein [Bacillus sp. CRN 9]|nr:DinB family protein [Bacillus sp. CRN 9]